jgi:RNA polymerase sigma-70 factor (ECF subfamily)
LYWPLLPVQSTVIYFLHHSALALIFLKNDNGSLASDADLIGLYKSTADSRHLGVLYQRYMDLVFGVCLKYLKNSELAKDAVMDIYGGLGDKIMRHQVDNFKAWLHTVAKNHCLMYLRSPKNTPSNELHPSLMQSGEDAHLKNDILLQEENYKKLELCMQELTTEQQESIKLFYLQKKSYHEIAAITGYDWNKVRSYIQNGKRNLKTCLETKGIFQEQE